MEYSGRTSSLKHKREDWKDHGMNVGKECIRKVHWFDAQWSNCPVEVEEEVKKMWRDLELGNDHYFIRWDWDMEVDYPLVSEFILSKGLTKDDEIIIHWWW